MSTRRVGINWHQVVGSTPVNLTHLITLALSKSGNIALVLAGAGNTQNV
jgi:hypothetical protein